MYIFFYIFQDKLFSPYHGSSAELSVGVKRGTLRFQVDVIIHYTTMPLHVTMYLFIIFFPFAQYAVTTVSMWRSPGGAIKSTRRWVSWHQTTVSTPSNVSWRTKTWWCCAMMKCLNASKRAVNSVLWLKCTLKTGIWLKRYVFLLIVVFYTYDRQKKCFFLCFLRNKHK